MFEAWLIELKRIWVEEDLDSLKDLVADEFEYYEDPFEPPITTIQKLIETWKEIKAQKHKNISIQPLIQSGFEGTASYDFSYENESKKKLHSKGVYYVKLNDEGKAIEFRQWWVNL